MSQDEGPLMKILVADDDNDLLLLLRFSLTQAGYQVIAVSDGASAIDAFAREAPDFALLDVNMPGSSGFQVCRVIRESSTIPVMMLTVRNQEEDLVNALELGADDYVTKPFSPRSLIARIRALSRRTEPTPVKTLRVQNLELDSEKSTLKIAAAAPLVLTALELKMMYALMSVAGRTLSADKLLGQVWGRSGSSERQALKQLIYRLRAKLRSAGASDELLATSPGAGYRLMLKD